MPRIVKSSALVIREAAELLREGEVVAFPTETVYGLGADTFNEQALEKIYQLKGRPSDNPLIAHVLDVNGARKLCYGWRDRCEQLAEAFWPGPLTMVVAKHGDIPFQATAGLETIAIRSPSHPDARALIKEFGGAISAPSANRSGHVSPTTAAHVAADFHSCEDLLILDGESSEVGIESTVIDMTGVMPWVLRPGSITMEMLEQVVACIGCEHATSQGASPGMTLSHYAPHTPTELVLHSQMPGRLKTLTEPAIVLARDVTYVKSPHRAIEMPCLSQEYARRLYSALREADAMSGKVILIEWQEEAGGEWEAILDRLQRASGGK